MKNKLTEISLNQNITLPQILWRETAATTSPTKAWTVALFMIGSGTVNRNIPRVTRVLPWVSFGDCFKYPEILFYELSCLSGLYCLPGNRTHKSSMCSAVLAGAFGAILLRTHAVVCAVAVGFHSLTDLYCPRLVPQALTHERTSEQRRDTHSNNNPAEHTEERSRCCFVSIFYFSSSCF